MKKLDECKETATGKRFSRKEEGKTFSLQSDLDFHCEIVDIDHCVLKHDSIRRCDWLFLVPKKENQHLKNQKSRAFFVELKGTEINGACEQLFNAIDRTKSQILNFEIEARVVGTRGFQPELKNTEYYRKVKRIIRKDIEFCKAHKGNNFTHIERIE
jgi:hypothetical protein